MNRCSPFKIPALGALLLVLAAGALYADSLPAHDPDAAPRPRLDALADTRVQLPSLDELANVVFLRSYNTRLVVLSTAVLGLATGLVGSFLLLRKRSLMGDALSHACLPGIGLAFMIAVLMGGSGKSLVLLLLGATLTGVLGVGSVLLIRNTTRVKDDAAMGIVLSVFFGFGVVIMGMVQTMPNASAAGLESFIYGKAASMVMQDFILICVVAAVIMVLSLLLLKEFTLLSFDEEFTHALGWPVHVLDIMMLTLVTAVTVIGLQSVGLILIIAFLITPAAAARFWTDDLKHMLLLSGFIGGVSGWVGSSMSALAPRLPAGAVIVLVVALVFVFSMLFGTARGATVRFRVRRRLQRKVGRQHLLRAVYELLQEHARVKGMDDPVNEAVLLRDVLAKRAWSPRHVKRLIVRAGRKELISRFDGLRVQLSEWGFGEAARTSRNHLLWEEYLVTHADIAPQHIDRDADMVEHILGPAMVRQLEEQLIRRGQDVVRLTSRHPIGPGRAAS